MLIRVCFIFQMLIDSKFGVIKIFLGLSQKQVDNLEVKAKWLRKSSELSIKIQIIPLKVFLLGMFSIIKDQKVLKLPFKN